MPRYKDVYGKYSQGSGSILNDVDKVWERIDDPDVMHAYN